jgi:cytochrome c peroxidase
VRDLPRSRVRIRLAQRSRRGARRAGNVLAGYACSAFAAYKEYTTPYADLADNPDGVSGTGPGGGFTWDGRAATLADQARIPLLASNEMANASEADAPGLRDHDQPQAQDGLN